MTGASKMVEASGPVKLFIGGLSMQTNEKTLAALFGTFGPLTEVLLIKDRETNKSRGFAFITFDRCEDAADAEKHTNGKSLDGKKIKVAQANKPSFQSGGRQRFSLTSRNRGGARNLPSGSGARGEAREHPSGGTHWDDGGYALNRNISSSRGHCPFQTGPRSRNGDPLTKVSATSASRRRSQAMGKRASPERDNNGGAPCNEPIYSHKGDYLSLRDDACPTHYSYSRRDYLTSPDTWDDRDYGYKGHWEELCYRRCSGRDGYGGDRDRATSDYRIEISCRDSKDRYRRWHGAPPAGRPRLMSGGSRGYDDHCSSRQTAYERGRENYLGSGRYSCSRGHEHGGRQDRGFSPPVWQDTPCSRESCRSQKKGALPMNSWGNSPKTGC